MRIQAAYLSDKELKRIMGHINLNKEESGAETEMDENLISQIEQKSGESGLYAGMGGYEDEDPLYEEAKKAVIEANKGSASLLQRRLRVGYARAARLIDVLEEKGIIGPGEGAKPREVYSETESKEPVPLEQDFSFDGDSKEDKEEWKQV